MYVIAVHNITDPEGYGAVVERIPSGMTLHSMFPSEDGAQAVCLWEAGSVEDVRSFVDGATAGLARNDYIPVVDAKAIGLPQPSTATA
jgi:hypothetical protein